MALSEENLSRLFNVFFQGQKFVKNNVFLSIVLLYAVYAFLKNLGLLRKKHLKNQHVFITGGAMGIGRLMVKKLMILGCKVTVADMNKEALQKLQLDMKNYGTNLKTVICDVSNPENVAKAAEEARTAFGVVDILINNAGIVSGKKILDNTEQKIQQTIAVNCTSHHYTVRQFLPDMLKQNKGHIVTIASVAGLTACSGLVDYCASKFGAVGFDESLRVEMKTLKKNIKTTCICPYFINTGMFEGVQNRLQMILPILKEDYVASRIILAIQQEEPNVVMPWLLNVFIGLKSVLPVALFDYLCDICGANASMETFKGRQQH